MAMGTSPVVQRLSEVVPNAFRRAHLDRIDNDSILCPEVPTNGSPLLPDVRFLAFLLTHTLNPVHLGDSAKAALSDLHRNTDRSHATSLSGTTTPSLEPWFVV